MQEADAGAPEGLVCFADEQTAGRGRGAHTWQSPPGSGLYVSVLLRPKIAPADVLWLSLAAGLAVREAIQQVTGLEADLRWPNDLLFGPKKFCGILTELNAEVTRVRHLVVGIGINVHQERFPEELSLAGHLAPHRNRQTLVAAGDSHRLAQGPSSRSSCTRGSRPARGSNPQHSRSTRAIFNLDTRQAGTGRRSWRLLRCHCRP